MSHRDRRALSIRGRAAKALPLASALAVLLAGCTAPEQADEAPPPAADGVETGASAPLPPPPDVPNVCPDTRRVGKMLGSSNCPSASGPWLTQPLFEAGAPDPLSRYCLYTWTTSGTPDLTMLPSEASRLGSAWTDADCMAVTTSGTADDAEDTVRGSLRTAFWNAVERPASLPMPGPGGAAVRVAVVDTWADPAAVGTFSHGAGMGGIVEDLTCDLLSLGANSCPVHIVPQLALNLLEPGVRDNTDGGYFGYQAHLARAIYDAVTAWQSEEPAAKLAVNLSVAWDAAYEYSASGADRPSALAVRDAIDNAVCAGALVVAAAGNSSFGAVPATGLMYPAAFASGPANCGGTSVPRVWPVGGVDAKDRPLYNARPNGLPKIVAPGELVYGNPTLSTGALVHAGPFTGASPATAVVTATAAAVWMYDSTLTATGVMALVGGAAAPLSTPVTACPASGCGTALRVSLCRAARTRAPGGAGAVPCVTHGDGGGVLPVWTSAQGTTVDGFAVARYLGPALTGVLSTGSACTATKSIYVPAGTVSYAGPSPCPMDQYSNDILDPVVGPQPGPDPCGACAIGASPTSDAWLQIGVSSEMTGPVYLQVLSLYKAGAIVRRYDVGSLTYGGAPARNGFYPNNVYTLGVATAGFTDFDAAVIEWVNSPNIQTTSKIVVYTR